MGDLPAAAHLAKWQKREAYLRQQIAAVRGRLARDTGLLATYERALPEAQSMCDKWARRAGLPIAGPSVQTGAK
jgi:hypothetical protein